MKRIKIFLLCTILPGLLFAQENIIRGVVHTFEKIPLIGAEIQVKSTKESVFTDSLGTFTIKCNPEDKLRVMARGFYTQNVKVTGEIKMVAVNLKPKPGEKQQEYAIGYGYVSERDKTSAVSGINTNSASFVKYSDMYDLIRGQLPGVQVIGGELRIRGSNSFKGSSAALIVVDGVISDYEVLDTLSPLEVKSISVIKDGSAAVFGSRGANGIVLIETNRGGDKIRR